MSGEKYDWTTFSDYLDSLDIYGNTLRTSMSSNAYMAKTRFKARAITDMFELTPISAMAIDGGATNVDGSKRWAFKARIIGENSPHSFLPDPCDPAFSADESATYRIIAMHTTFLSTAADSGENVTRGDIVVVEIDRSGFSYDLEYGRFISISAHENPAKTGATACSSLVGLMGGWGGAPGLRRGYASAGVAPAVGTLGTTAPCARCIPFKAGQPVQKSYKMSGNAPAFFTKLKNSPHFAGFSDALLAGITANAQAESNFSRTAAGDSLKWYEKGHSDGRISLKKIKEVRARNLDGDCSFSYWQTNICPTSGGGSSILKALGIDPVTDKAGAKAAITSEDTQFRFMAQKMKQLFPNWETEDDPYVAGYIITVKFERPTHYYEKGRSRGALAKEIFGAATAITSR